MVVALLSRNDPSRVHKRTNKGTIRQLLETQPQAEEGRLDINNTHNEPGCYVFKFCFEYTPKLFLHKQARIISDHS